ncbi:hemophore-related protein [Mycobacterium sp. Y57]|nr:hemophore-related protein [Mycolicibacterium xanthum]
MVALPKLATWAVTLGGLTLWSVATVATASADPDLAPVIHTTCSYSQAVAALNSQNPQAASELAAAPMAQAWLQQFLAAPPQTREVMAGQIRQLPGAEQYLGLVVSVAQGCASY